MSSVVLFRSYESDEEGVVFTANMLRLRVRVPHDLLKHIGDGQPVNAIAISRTSAAQIEAAHGPAPDELGMDD
jgi:hypothetical protein